MRVPTNTWDYRILFFPGKTQVEVAGSTGKTKTVHISDVKYIFPGDRVISKLPDYQSFVSQSKLSIDPKDSPILNGNLL